jgi:predicted TIM-barrel fold metal-dependent hydrolase
MKFDIAHFNKPWKISLEDHYQTADAVDLAAKYATGSKEAWQRLSSNLLDFTKQRVEQMDQTGIELAILSLAPGVEGIYDKQRAVQVARRSNDVVANAMAKNPDRFRSFAALPCRTRTKLSGNSPVA